MITLGSFGKCEKSAKETEEATHEKNEMSMLCHVNKTHKR